MSRPGGLLILAGLLVLGNAGCPSAVPASGNWLVLVGSSTMAPLVRDIAKRFEATHPGLRIEVQSSTSGQGVLDTRQGLADIGLVARALRPDEPPLHAVTLAREGIALPVHRDNPVPGLTDEQVAGLFNRTLTGWLPLGGPDRPVVLIGPLDGHPIREAFLDHFHLRPAQVKFDRIIPAGDHAPEMVAASSGAV